MLLKTKAVNKIVYNR